MAITSLQTPLRLHQSAADLGSRYQRRRPSKSHDSLNGLAIAADSIGTALQPSRRKGYTMRILLDDRETTLHAETVEVALREAATLVGKSGRMIVEIEVDGIAWGEEDLASPEHAKRGAREIRLATAHPAELLRDTFVNATEAVLNAEEIQRSAAKLMQANREGEGMQKLLEALAIWNTVQLAIARCFELTVITREEVRAAGIDLDGAIAALDTQLRTLRDAMQSKDMTGVSDCLMYEFPETTRRFAQTLASIASAVGKIAAAKK